MPRWLLKTEPTSYSYDDLVEERRAVWDGVKNPLALKHLRSAKKGDAIFIYHTGDEKAVVGIAEAASDPYEDPKTKDPKLFVIDLVPSTPMARPVTLAEMKANTRLAGFDLLRLPRLSVMPVSEEQWREILRMAGGPGRS